MGLVVTCGALLGGHARAHGALGHLPHGLCVPGRRTWGTSSPTVHPLGAMEAHIEPLSTYDAPLGAMQPRIGQLVMYNAPHKVRCRSLGAYARLQGTYKVHRK